MKKHFSDFYWKDYLNITIGALLYSFGVIGFIQPAGIVIGGVSGISLLVEYASGIPLQYTYFVINIVLLLIGLKALGFKFLLKTIYCVLAATIFLSVLRTIITQPLVENEMLMSGIIGAMLCGAGMAFVFGSNGSTGGVSIIVSIINKYRNVSFGRGIMFVDFVIICCSLFVFRDFIKIVHGLIVMGVMIYTIDLVMNGLRQSVQFMIISSKYEQVADAINNDLKRGCTVLDGTGWYSKNPTKVIMLLARQSEATEVFRMVKSIDDNAFISQSVVRGVWGQGFDVMKFN